MGYPCAAEPPEVQRRFVLSHNQFLLAQTNSGCHPDISSGGSACRACSGCAGLMGILSAFPAERLDFLAWCSHAPLPASSCTFGCGPCDPCRDHSQQIRQGSISPQTQDVPHSLAVTENRDFPLKTGLEISALITDSGEELQTEPGKEVVQELWFQCPA